MTRSPETLSSLGLGVRGGDHARLLTFPARLCFSCSSMAQLQVGAIVRLRANPDEQGIVRHILDDEDARWVLVKWIRGRPTAHLEEDLELLEQA